MNTPAFIEDKQFYSWVKKQHPSQRWGRPEEPHRHRYLLIIHRASDYINGQIIYVDGGWLRSFISRPHSTLLALKLMACVTPMYADITQVLL